MEKILLIEDDESLGAILKERLERESFECVWHRTLNGALNAVKTHSFDLFVVDLNLSGGTGFEFVQQSHSHTASPFIFITALNSAENRLKSYELGAVDFIPKPFHFKELLIRINRVLATYSVKTLQVRHLQIHLAEHRIVDLRTGIDIELTPRDFKLLTYLVQRAPNVVSRDEILNNIVGSNRFPSERVVDNSVVRIRQALGDTTLIRSIRGVGYQWIAEEGETNEQ